MPLATLSGEGGKGPDFSTIAGTTMPFGADEVWSLYGSEQAFLAKFDASMADAIDTGFVLQADAEAMHDAAATVWPDPDS